MDTLDTHMKINLPEERAMIERWNFLAILSFLQRETDRVQDTNPSSVARRLYDLAYIVPVPLDTRTIYFERMQEPT